MGDNLNLYFEIPKIVKDYSVPVIGLGDFVEKRSMLGTPRELFMNYNIEIAMLIGNHDYEAIARKSLNKRGIKEDFYSRVIKKSKIKKFNEDWFITQVDSIEDILEKRVYRTYSGNYAIYFMHMPPTEMMVHRILRKDEGKKVILLCGHVHGHDNIFIKQYSYRGSKAVEFIFPTFKENQTLYRVIIDNSRLELIEIKPSIIEKELLIEEIPKVEGDTCVHYY